MEFKFYKNQEIPEFHFSLENAKGHIDRPSEKARAEDYVDFSITLIDNGDDKLCLEGKSFHSSTLIVPLAENKTQNLVC